MAPLPGGPHGRPVETSHRSLLALAARPNPETSAPALPNTNTDNVSTRPPLTPRRPRPHRYIRFAQPIARARPHEPCRATRSRRTRRCSTRREDDRDPRPLRAPSRKSRRRPRGCITCRQGTTPPLLLLPPARPSSRTCTGTGRRSTCRAPPGPGCCRRGRPRGGAGAGARAS